MASLQGWWVRETFLRAVEVAAPPALAVAGAVYRGVTAPLSRFRFLYIHNKLLAFTPRKARLRYVLMNKPYKAWPQNVMEARPALGATVPYALISSLSYTIYIAGKRLWIKTDDSPRTQLAKSAVAGAVAGFSTRYCFHTKPHYRMVLPAPYLATALPLFDYLRPTHSIVTTSLLAALIGSFADAVFARLSSHVLFRVQTKAGVRLPPPGFKSVREALLWAVMQSSRALPRALLLGSLDFFLRLVEPWKHHPRAYLTPAPPPRPRSRSRASESGEMQTSAVPVMVTTQAADAPLPVSSQQVIGKHTNSPSAETPPPEVSS